MDDRHHELFLIMRLLDDLREPAPSNRTHEIVAPTWILGPAIRGAAVHAVESLAESVRTFAADKGELTPEEVRGAVDAAAALTATLIGLEHVEHHAVDA